MNLFELFAKIGLDTSEYENGLKAASGLTQSFGEKAKAALGTVAKVGAAGLTAASAGVIAFGKSSVDAGKQFDSSMAQVAATMGKTVDEITNLRDFAREMGAKTAFSASEAADALNYMALAGYDAETSMSMLPNVLNLAAAGGMDLASASDMITDSQTALGLSIDQTVELVDMMAVAASKTNTSVSQMGDAILTVGGTAKQLKGGTNELNTVLGVLADSSIKAGEGGTHLRNIILAMNPTTKAAKEAFKELGIATYDAEGNLRSIPDIFTEMSAAMEGMTEKEKMAMKTAIFNTTDLAAVDALLSTEAERYREISSALDDAAGAAERMGETQLDNLAGDITKWGSALGEAQIIMSDILTPSLRGFVQLGTEGLTAVTDAFKDADAVQSLAQSFRDADGELLPLEESAERLTERFSGLSALAPYFSFRDEMGELGEISDLADGLYQTLSGMSYDQQLDVAKFFGLDNVDDLYGILDPMNELHGKLEEIITTADAATQEDINLLQSLFPDYDMEEILSWFDGTEEGFEKLQSAIENTDASQLTDGFSAAMEVLPGVIDNALGMVMEAIPRVVEIGGQILGAVVSGVINNLPVLAEGAVQAASAFAGYLTDELTNALDSLGILEPVTEAFSGVGEAFDRIGEAVSPLVEKFTEWAASAETAQGSAGILETALTLLGDAASGVAGFIADIVEIVAPLAEKFADWATEADLAQSATGLLEGALGLLGDAVSIVAGFVVDIVGAGADFIDWLTGGSTEATKLAAAVGGIVTAIGLFQAALAINTLIGTFGTVLNTAKTAIDGAKLSMAGFNAIMAANPVIAVVTVLGFLVGAFITAYNTSEDFRNKVDAAFNVVKTTVENVVSAIVNFFTVSIPNAFHATIAKVTEVKDAIITKFNEAVEFLKSLPDKAYQWGADMMNNFKQAIFDNPVAQAISGVASTVASFIGFSEPDKGPLSNFHTFAPDMLNLFAEGIRENTPVVAKAIEGTASAVKDGLDTTRDWASEVGQYVSVNLANGIEKESTEAEKAAEKVASNIYNGLSKWADRVTKYEALTLTEQLELWETILAQFTEGTDQWWSAYDKVFDLREKVLDEQTKAMEDAAKAEERAVKDRYATLTTWMDKVTKYTDASSTEQLRAWTKALSAFEAGSEQYAAIEEKLFDLRLSAYQDYADGVEEIAGNINAIQERYDNAVQKRTEEIVNSYKLFDEVPERQEVSGRELLNNLQRQTQSIRRFYDNLAELQERGMSAAVVEEIRSMGVGAADELDALLKLSDRQLSQYAALYEEKQSLANEIALSELGELRDETASELREQMDALKTLYDENAPTLGESFAEGIAQGIRDGLAGVMEAATEVAQRAMERTREILNGGGYAVNAAYSVSGENDYRADYNAIQRRAESVPAVSYAASGAYSGASGQVAERPIEVVVKAEPAPLVIDGREFARVIYQYLIDEINRHGQPSF